MCSPAPLPGGITASVKLKLPTVSKVINVASFVPDEQKQKLAIAGVAFVCLLAV